MKTSWKMCSTAGAVVWLLACVFTPFGVTAGTVVTFELLGDLPGGIDESWATDVSENGAVVVGYSQSAEGTEAFLWKDGVMTGLGDLPGGDFWSAATGVSADGLTIVGHGESANGTEAFRWKDGNMIGLGDLPGGGFYSVANAISADGMIIVGSSASDAGLEVVRWGNGPLTSLGFWPGWTGWSFATSVSYDGSVIVGAAGPGTPWDDDAFRWEDGRKSSLDNAPFSDLSSDARDVSRDGSLVVGLTEVAEINVDWYIEAAIWSLDNDWSMTLLNDLLDDHGINRGGFDLREATAISADGTTIVGYGLHIEGSMEAYRVRILPEYTFSRVMEGAIAEDAGHFASCAWGDYDGDGYVDLFAGSLGAEAGRLYQNEGDGSFTRVIDAAISEGMPSATQAATWGDFDNDGDLDLYVSNYAPVNEDRFYRNEGDGSFVLITEGGWMAPSVKAQSAAWCDYDNDGLLDLFVGNPSHIYTNFLFHHEGNGSVLLHDGPDGIQETRGCTWSDYDLDGDVDLFMAQPSMLYRNDGGGAFTEMTPDILPGAPVGKHEWMEFGVATGDYDNDGDLDLAVAGLVGNRLYRNDLESGFVEITGDVISTDPATTTVSPLWGDYDNDGYLDLLIPRARNEESYLYHNEGDGSFSRDTGNPLGTHRGGSWTGAWADYDNDGDLDFVFSDGLGWGPEVVSPRPLALYRNEGGTNHWLLLKLVGVASNRSAIGAKVFVETSDPGAPSQQMREVCAAAGFSSQNDLRVHFGLGDADTIDSLRIEWPSGIVDELTDVVANQIYTITEGSTTTTVYFPDPNLEAAIRDALRKPMGDITKPDMELLTEFYADHSPISDLRGLEYATNLTELDLTGDQIVDISPLTNLKKLVNLDVGINEIEDISPLAKLTNLENLQIHDNQISDISPLTGLANLSYLELGNNQIVDLSPLTGLAKLTYLNLSGNQISDISPLAGLANLRDWCERGCDSGLDLRHNYIAIAPGSPSLQIIDSLNAIEGLTVEYDPQDGVRYAPVSIAQPPQSLTTAPGSTATFSVVTGGTRAKSYEWRYGDTVVGGNSPTLKLTDVQGDHAGQYTVTVTAREGSVSSRTVTLGVKAPPYTEKLLNISTRGQILDGAKVLIAGFVLEGAGQKNVLIRGIGPGLGQWVDGVCTDPKLELFRVGDVSTAPMAANEAWGYLGVDVPTICRRVGAFALKARSKDAALYLALESGAYTAKVTALDGVGVGLVELYDADPDPQASTCQVANFSTRGEVGIDAQILIAGFIVEGDVPKQVLVRGIGPRLADFGVDGTLVDPYLRILKNVGDEQLWVASNNNWSDNPNAADIVAAGKATGAFDLDAGSRDAAILTWLEPGSYTAQVSGIGITTGVALVEVYEIGN